MSDDKTVFVLAGAAHIGAIVKFFNNKATILFKSGGQSGNIPTAIQKQRFV